MFLLYKILSLFPVSVSYKSKVKANEDKRDTVDVIFGGERLSFATNLT